MKLSRVVFVSVLMIVTFSGWSVLAQSDSTQVEQKQVEQEKEWTKLRGYIGGVFERSPVSPRHTNSLGLQAAVLLKSHWLLGLYGTRYSADKYQERLIFPNVFQMNYKYGGLLVGYRTQFQKRYEMLFESKIGLGEVKWDEVESGDAVLADKFQVIQFQVGSDYLLTDFLAINAFAGYRLITGLDVTGLENDDFRGLYYGFAAKIGWFR